MPHDRVLITGALGFTGRYLAAHLSALGASVIGIGTDRTTDRDGLFDYHVVDLLDAAALRSVVARVRPDAVLHLAAISFVAHDDPAELYMTNIVGTRNLLQAFIEASFAPSVVVLASSASVYGIGQCSQISETVPMQPANDYGVSKAGMELLAATYQDRLPIIVTRPFNYTGRGQSEAFLVPKIVSHARRRAHRIELGNLDIERDFSDVRVVADIYARLLGTPDAIGQTVNICSGRTISLRTIFGIVEALSGHSMEIVVNPRFIRGNDVRTMCGDPRRLAKLIGSIDMPSIEETLVWMLEG